MGGCKDVEAVAPGVEEPGHVDEGADLLERSTADDARDEVLRQLSQDGAHLRTPPHTVGKKNQVLPEVPQDEEK